MQPFNKDIGDGSKAKQERVAVIVGRVEDVPAGRGATVELLDGRELALFNINGEFYAIENFCPHQGAPLADGTLCGHTVECDWHGWRFDVRTGQCLTTSSGDIDSHEVLIQDGLIKVVI